MLYSEGVRRALRRSPELTSHAMRSVRLLRRERRSTGGTNAASYCYSVWLRHLVVASGSGVIEVPRIVTELGPGDTIGIGLAALLSGAEAYFAVDAERYANVEQSLEVFEELLEMFRARAPIPAGTSLADVKPPLEKYDFPSDLLEDRLDLLLAPVRLDSIRRAIADMALPPRNADGGIRIAYFSPWDRSTPVPRGSVDLVLSQAVLEHIEDLAMAYAAMRDWLRPGGLISHQIDFRSHGTSFDWNGHWLYSEEQWRRVRNPQTWRAINRQPCSAHVRLAQENGFEILSTIRSETTGGICRAELADLWSGLSDADLVCSGVHILASKSTNAN